MEVSERVSFETYLGNTLQIERTASAKIPRQELAHPVQRITSYEWRE